MRSHRTYLGASVPLCLLLACAGGPQDDPPPDGLDTDLVEAAPVCARGGVAPSSLHRRTATELGIALEDLLQLQGLPLELLPGESRTRGFSNQTSSNPVDQGFVTPYTYLVDQAVTASVGDQLGYQRWEIEDAPPALGSLADVSELGEGVWWVLVYGENSFRFTIDVPETGKWRIALPARWWFGWEYEDGVGEPNRLRLLVDGVDLGEQPVTGTYFEPVDLEFITELAAGPHELEAVITWVGPEVSVAGVNSIGFDAVHIEGPLGGVSTPLHDLVEACVADGGAPRDCALELASRIARRAWSRPLNAPDQVFLGGLIDLALDRGDGAHTGLGLALQGTLLHPDFLFRIERAVEGDNPDAGSYALDPHALANRLASLVWSSVPDAVLLDCADSGTLDPLSEDECGLSRQLDRMLSDPRAGSLEQRFGFEWLQIDRLEALYRDDVLFPSFDADLASSMLEETAATLEQAWTEDAPVRSLLDSGETFADARLAQHYGLTPPEGSGTVAIVAPGRGALVQQASMLTTTSQAGRTSPVLRGVYVLTQLVCDPPGTPPQNVGPLDEQGDIVDNTTLHTSEPACFGCHKDIDPLGIALEEFDAIGAWREVDYTSELPDGTVLSDASSLLELLRQGDAFPECVASKLFTWTRNRGPGADEQALIQAMAAEDASFRDMLTTLVASPSFQCRVPSEL